MRLLSVNNGLPAEDFSLAGNFFIFGSEILNSCPFIVESIFMRTLTVLLSIEKQRNGSEWRIYNERNDNRRKVPAHNKGSG